MLLFVTTSRRFKAFAMDGVKGMAPPVGIVRVGVFAFTVTLDAAFDNAHPTLDDFIMLPTSLPAFDALLPVDISIYI